MKKRILYILIQYPQVSETYIRNEIENVEDRYELAVYGHKIADCAYKDAYPYHIGEPNPEKVLDSLTSSFSPDVVHFHYLTTTWMYFDFCKHYNLPFTVRAHSFDTLVNCGNGYKENVESLKKYSEMINSDLCQGVLAFPFSIPPLIDAGANQEKLTPAYPVVDVGRFFDKSANGPGVINMGAALGKKKMDDFFKLAKLRPELTFNLYPIGYSTDQLKEENRKINGPCHIHETLDPKDMPPIYKQHRWLVYTGDFNLKTVGWPIAVAEAQAAGVGVCMANLRPDLAEYVGDGGGILFDDIRDVADIVTQDVPNNMRERGFELCWRSDIAKNITQLTDIWDRV
jgi:hypothetical protein